MGFGRSDNRGRAWRREQGRTKDSKSEKKPEFDAEMLKQKRRYEHARLAESSSIKRLSDHELLSDDKFGTLRLFVQNHCSGYDFLSQLESLVVQLRNFRTIKVDFSTVVDFWGNRSATEIVRERTFFALKQEGKYPEYGVEGCMDAATACLATVRALIQLKNIPARAFFVREEKHAYVRVNYNGKNYRLDPGNSPARGAHSYVFKEITPVFQQGIKLAKQRGAYAEGFGPREIGLRSLTDFNKYASN